MNDKTQHQGSCFCGEVQFTVSGAPEAMAYCHCDSCRQWSAGPVSAFTLWKPTTLKITQGLDNIAGFDKNPLSDDDTVVMKDFVFKPVFHVHYQESVHAMKDGLPKFKDLPKEAGGSGEQLGE
jgi:hypothetical protein